MILLKNERQKGQPDQGRGWISSNSSFTWKHPRLDPLPVLDQQRAWGDSENFTQPQHMSFLTDNLLPSFFARASSHSARATSSGIPGSSIPRSTTATGGHAPASVDRRVRDEQRALGRARAHVPLPARDLAAGREPGAAPARKAGGSELLDRLLEAGLFKRASGRDAAHEGTSVRRDLEGCGGRRLAMIARAPTKERRMIIGGARDYAFDRTSITLIARWNRASLARTLARTKLIQKYLRSKRSQRS